MPLVIEIVDSEKNIDAFIPRIKEIFEKANNGGLITIEKAEIIHYASSK
jgi:PII-like signaling protein